jgi:hypothetical protein
MGVEEVVAEEVVAVEAEVLIPSKALETIARC